MKIIRHVKGTNSFCVQFSADSNNNQDMLNLNVVSRGHCWALVEICALGTFYLLNLIIMI